MIYSWAGVSDVGSSVKFVQNEFSLRTEKGIDGKDFANMAYEWNLNENLRT